LATFSNPLKSRKPRRTFPAPSFGTDYLPGGTLSALAGGGSPNLDWSLALGLTVLYGIAATAISLVTFRQRDITG